MQTNRNRITAILVSVSALALACVTLLPTPTATPRPTPSPIPPTATVTETPLPTLTPTPSYPIVMGGPVRINSSGFRVDRIKGYTLQHNNGGAYMTSDDEKVQVAVFAYAAPGGYTISGLAKQFGRNLGVRYTDSNFEIPVKGLFGQVEMVTMAYSGQAEEEPVRGVLSIYEPEDSKLVYILVEAFGDQRWEREGQRAFESVSASLSLFPIQIWEKCPIHKNGGYGASPDWPIQIGGGLAAGEARTRDYLDALIGKRGEPVGYYREGTVEGKNGTLDKYYVVWGSQRLTLYFDIYNYSPLNAPAALTCSAPLPLTPVQ